MRALLVLFALFPTSAQADVMMVCADVAKIMISADVTYHNPTPRGIVMNTEITVWSDNITVACNGDLMTVFGIGTVTIVKKEETTIFVEQSPLKQ